MAHENAGKVRLEYGDFSRFINQVRKAGQETIGPTTCEQVVHAGGILDMVHGEGIAGKSPYGNCVRLAHEGHIDGLWGRVGDVLGGTNAEPSLSTSTPCFQGRTGKGFL